MKVLHIMNELKPSGGEVMLYAAGPILKDYGITGEILSTGNQPGPYAEALANAGYKIHHIQFVKSPFFFLALYRLLKANRYDVVHLHTEQANFWFGLLALLCAKRAVRTIHSNFAFTGFLGWRRKWHRQLLHKLGLTHIAISQSVHDTEYQYFGLNTPIIPNWYNSLRFVPSIPAQRASARQKLNILEPSFVLVSVGNCSEIKNHPVLIQALAKVQQGHFIYLHVGIEKDNSEQVLAKQLGISEKIIFLGMQTDILPYLQAADLFVMTSTHEGCPISAIEAIACGLPALLTDVPGLADFSALFQGLTYAKSNPESIGAVLSELMSLTPEQLKQNCAHNAQQAELIFGIKRGLSAYVHVYTNRR